tara:strand:- start:281 stop:793 length:513 start_codon:yes stop_codon:yes gene_type:complete
MSKLKVFLTLSGYQLTWLACVFGESKFSEPFLGIYIGIIYLFIFIYFNKNKIRFIILSLYLSIPGYLFDTFMVYFSIYEFNSSIIMGTLPSWMIILWLSFSTLFDQILTILKKYKLIGIMLSSILGPLTYYLGQPIGVISIIDFYLFFITMIVFWFLFMIYYLEVILRRV